MRYMIISTFKMNYKNSMLIVTILSKIAIFILETITLRFTLTKIILMKLSGN